MTVAQRRVAVVGSLNLDLVVRVPRLPGPGETVSGEDM
ncbi:MAG TPA: ribokinase, partial [Actinomycetes bacterium]|nr:ribokinase [Actinomycetes bacterium]